MPAPDESQLQYWMPYQVGDEAPWNVRRVIHLHRRAGFGATWEEVERDLGDGPAASIDRLLDGQAYTTGVPPDFDALSRLIGDSAVAANSPNRLKAWWLYRMIFSPDPLTERLTLMWHNHFATSNLKVNEVQQMRAQNDVFREFARGPFGELLARVVKHPAMLVWLDADSNRKEHPNENLARELMELFSMGVGNYGEQDIREAARALTGWTAKNGSFRYVDAYHDDGDKTIFNQTGNFAGDELLHLVLQHPATARRLAGRVCQLFFGETTLDEAAIDELAAGLRERDLDVGWAVATVLRSQAFFADGNIGNRVLGPAEFVVGAVRSLEVFDPPPSTLVLSEWTARLGQDLFYPPNVFGWPGGRDWITTRSMIARTAFAAQLVDGSLRRPVKALDVQRLIERYQSRAALDPAQFCTELLISGDSQPLRQRILDVGFNADQPGKTLEMILASPEAQLG